MENKCNNEAFIGNGKLLAGYSSKGELLRMSYPSVDYKQAINFFHVGVKINDSAIIYLHDDINNHYNQSYIDNTNILNTKIYNSYFNLEVETKDFVDIKKDLIVKKYILKNNNTIDLNIDFLIHSEFSQSNEDPISARIFNEALIQYNYNYSFAIFSDNKIASKQIHNSKENIKSGVIFGKDYIGMSNDSSISYALEKLKPGEEKIICIYIYAKENEKETSFEEIADEIENIKKIDVEKQYNQVKKYWEKYLQEHYFLKR